MDDLASALTASLAKNGETTPTANLPMGTYRHTGVGNGSARTDYAAMGQVQDGNVNWADGGGTADAITATYSPVITALVDGQLCHVRATAANATTTPTFAPNGLTARTIVKNGGVALAAGDIAGDGHELILRYDLTNTRWQLMNPAQDLSPPDLSSRQPIDDQLTTLAGITAQQATDLASVSTFIGTLLNDADAATARTTLGAKSSALDNAFSAYSNANQTVVSGANTLVTLGTEEFDLSNTFAASRFTPNVAGYYNINWSVLGEVNSTTSVVISRLYKNGAQYRDGSRVAANNTTHLYVGSTGSTVLYLNGTTDYVELFVAIGGVTVLGGAANTHMSGFRIG